MCFRLHTGMCNHRGCSKLNMSRPRIVFPGCTFHLSTRSLRQMMSSWDWRNSLESGERNKFRWTEDAKVGDIKGKAQGWRDIHWDHFSKGSHCRSCNWPIKHHFQCRFARRIHSMGYPIALSYNKACRENEFLKTQNIIDITKKEGQVELLMTSYSVFIQ